MSNLTVEKCRKTIEYEVGSTPGGPLEMRELVNRAGERMVAMHPWRWLEGRELRLRPRPPITVAAATWTEATKTLTLTGAFTDYNLLTRDVFRLTGGTGATVGTYEVATRPTANTITLRTSIGAAADGQADIEGTLPNDQIELPTEFDLQAITAWAATDGLLRRFQFTTPQGLLDLRQWPGVTNTWSFYTILNYVTPYGGGQPVPRLDSWQGASSDDEQLVIMYRAGWKEPETDEEELSFPSYMNGLFEEILKAVVMGIEERGKGTIDQRLAQVRNGLTFIDTRDRDSMAMVEVGERTGGWLDDGYERYSRFEPLNRVAGT